MPAQLALFGPEPRSLVDDASGRIVYYPDVLAPDEARQLFEFVREHASWSNETMWMYDKMVDVPRLVARYLAGDLPPTLDRARRRVERLLGERFTTVGLNFYRDGRDSVAWHNDKLGDMPPEPTIALLSLGATRQMLLRTKRTPRTTHAIDLESGSLLVMGGASQAHWEHAIPKSPRALDPRISIAFRPRIVTGTVSAMKFEKSRSR